MKNDAPERIWMDGDIEAGEGYWTRCFEDRKPCSEPALEYIRADHALALVAEAYEVAGDAAADAYDAMDMPTGSDMAGFIRSLTPSDALAALAALAAREARDKQVRECALRKALAIAKRYDEASGCMDCTDTANIHREILNLIEGDQTDGRY